MTREAVDRPPVDDSRPDLNEEAADMHEDEWILGRENGLVGVSLA